MSHSFGTTVESAGGREVLSGRFRDFDDLSAAASAWDLDFVQLDAGPAPAGLTQIATSDLLIQKFSFGRAYLQRGASPSTMRTFGLVDPEGGGARMFGAELTDSDLALFRPDGEFEAVSSPGCGSLAISIDEARLEEAFATADLPRGKAALRGSGLLRTDPRTIRKLRHRAAHLLDLLKRVPAALQRSDLEEELTHLLPLELALAIGSADGPPRPAPLRVRDLAVRRAVSIIRDRLDEAVTIGELREEVGVGWTTLVQGFREHFGVTPKAYLHAVRLNSARSQLLDAGPEVPVADVANRWGFWHMGQFAADYRRLFGELPSGTKSRTPAGAEAPG